MFWITKVCLYSTFRWGLFAIHIVLSLAGKVWYDDWYLCISWKLKIYVIVRHIHTCYILSFPGWGRFRPSRGGAGELLRGKIALIPAVLWARVLCPTPRLDYCSRHCINCIFELRTAKRCSHNCKALCVTVSRDLINQKKVIVVQSRCQKNGKSTVNLVRLPNLKRLTFNWEA